MNFDHDDVAEKISRWLELAIESREHPEDAARSREVAKRGEAAVLAIKSQAKIPLEGKKVYFGEPIKEYNTCYIQPHGEEVSLSAYDDSYNFFEQIDKEISTTDIIILLYAHRICYPSLGI